MAGLFKKRKIAGSRFQEYSLSKLSENLESLYLAQKRWETALAAQFGQTMESRIRRYVKPILKTPQGIYLKRLWKALFARA